VLLKVTSMICYSIICSSYNSNICQ